jgi:hypothetical protein
MRRWLVLAAGATQMLYWRQQASSDHGKEKPMPFGFHWFDLIPVFFVLIPVLVGFLWIRSDANTRGQPGLLWALLTLPLNWLAVLAYLVVRALTPTAPRQ